MKGDATHQAERRTRRRLLAAIHAEATRVNLDEAARRDLQEHLTGQRSCRAMSLAELRRVADAIRRGTGRPGPRDVSRPVDDRAGMRRRALALAASFGAATRTRAGEPWGAAARVAADVLHETVAAGGPRRDAELLLLSLAGCQVFVAGGRRRRGWENRPPRGGVDSP